MAHDWGLELIRRGVVSAPTLFDPRLKSTRFGVTFANPIGLAAGFDKNGVAVDRWHELGFGFAELGTVTAHAQPGNPKPRLFRLPESRAIVNRMGFNNLGSSALASRLQSQKSEIPIGINLGKSKITELKDAATDYQTSFKRLHLLGDYFVINVSSPNTPGLRALQDRSALDEIILAMQAVDAAVPLFVKIAPDLSSEAIDDALRLALDRNLAGLIATNTTLDRSNLPVDPKIDGGLSGAPLCARANEVMRQLSSQCPPEFTLIGVGGLFSGTDVFERMRSGAHLCQLYTGWVYGGPGTAPRVLRELLELMERDSIARLEEIRAS